MNKFTLITYTTVLAFIITGHVLVSLVKGLFANMYNYLNNLSCDSIVNIHCVVSTGGTALLCWKMVQDHNKKLEEQEDDKEQEEQEDDEQEDDEQEDDKEQEDDEQDADEKAEQEAIEEDNEQDADEKAEQEAIEEDNEQDADEKAEQEAIEEDNEQEDDKEQEDDEQDADEKADEKVEQEAIEEAKQQEYIKNMNFNHMRFSEEYKRNKLIKALSFENSHNKETCEFVAENLDFMFNNNYTFEQLLIMTSVAKKFNIYFRYMIVISKCVVVISTSFITEFINWFASKNSCE